jgi:hypothetical protein
MTDDKSSILNYHTPAGAIPGDEFVKLVANMRASQKRWPMHPQQASIETMALEMKVDEALERGVVMSVVRQRPGSEWAAPDHATLDPISETDGLPLASDAP